MAYGMYQIDTALFPSSDRAGYITGSGLPIDGGESLG